MEHRHEHQDPPRVRGQLQVAQSAADGRMIGVGIEAEEAITSSYSRHVPYASDGDPAVRSIPEAADFAEDVQLLQERTDEEGPVHPVLALPHRRQCVDHRGQETPRVLVQGANLSPLRG